MFLSHTNEETDGGRSYLSHSQLNVGYSKVSFEKKMEEILCTKKHLETN